MKLEGMISRRQAMRSTRSGSVRSDESAIPDKTYLRIGEVSDLVETKPYVLRYWETEFPMLRPIKSRTGHRLYRRDDVKMALTIKRLLYEEGFTIEGARKHLANPSNPPPRGANPPASQSDNGAALNRQQLNGIKREIQSILTVLARKC